MKLTQDNGSQNEGYEKITVEISKENLHYEIIQYFKWRKNKDDIEYTISRFKGLGSSQHDKFIEHLSNKGY